MARTGRPIGYKCRGIDISMWDSEKVGLLTDSEFRLFISMISHSYDQGKQKASPAKLSGWTWFYGHVKQIGGPLSDRPNENTILIMLSHMKSIGLIDYAEIEGEWFYALAGWDHQNIAEPHRDIFPEFSPTFLKKSQDKSMKGSEGKGIEGNRSEGNSAALGAAPPKPVEPFLWESETGLNLTLSFLKRIIAGDFPSIPKGETIRTLEYEWERATDHLMKMGYRIGPGKKCRYKDAEAFFRDRLTASWREREGQSGVGK